MSESNWIFVVIELRYTLFGRLDDVIVLECYHSKEAADKFIEERLKTTKSKRIEYLIHQTELKDV